MRKLREIVVRCENCNKEHRYSEFDVFSADVVGVGGIVIEDGGFCVKDSSGKNDDEFGNSDEKNIDISGLYCCVTCFVARITRLKAESEQINDER